MALIRVSRTGICGTDVHNFNGHSAADRLSLIPCHEFCGMVAAYGAHVKYQIEGPRVGGRYQHRLRHLLLVPSHRNSELPGDGQVGLGRDGAFAEYIALPARLMILAPDGISDAVLALTEPVACVMRAARKAQVSFGQSVVVLGAGPIGNLHVQMMRLLEALWSSGVCRTGPVAAPAARAPSRSPSN